MATVSATVAMAATTSMSVVGNSHVTTPPLATGYIDDVFTTRLAGDIN